jgi:hypothetical protein
MKDLGAALLLCLLYPHWQMKVMLLLTQQFLTGSVLLNDRRSFRGQRPCFRKSAIGFSRVRTQCIAGIDRGLVGPIS